MFGNPKISPEVRSYAKAQAKASKQWRKYKETGSERAHNKATYNYAVRDAISLQLKAPKASSKTTNFNIGNNNKSANRRSVSVNTRLRNSVKNY